MIEKKLKHYANYYSRKLKGYYKEPKQSYDLPQNYERIYFYHIRKTGGIAIKCAFLSISGRTNFEGAHKEWFRSPDFQLKGNDKIFVGWNIPLINKGNYYFGASHEPSHYLDLPKNTFTICCFREPSKRVVSHYNQIKGLIKNNIPHPMLKFATHWVEDGFKTFVDRLPDDLLNNQLYMFSPKLNAEEGVRNVKKVNYILHTESLRNDLDGLSNILNVALPLEQANMSKHKENISDSDYEYLKTKLKREYDFYNQIKELD